MNFNKCFLAGNFTHDPELQYTTGGTAYCSFQLGLNESWTNDDGERQERSDFLRFIAWGNAAEFIAKYFTKGRPVFIECKARQDTWEDKDGVERQGNSFQVIRADFTDSKPDGDDNNGGQPTNKPEPKPKAGDTVDDDDIPF